MRKITILVEELPENFIEDSMEDKPVTVTGTVEEISFIDTSEEIEKTCDTCVHQRTIDFDNTCNGCIRQDNSFDKWEQRK